MFLIFSCFSNKKLAEPKTVILPLSDTMTHTEGTLVYSLPRTIFTVFVEMERTVEKPGPYARFAGDMLGITDVILSESEFWSIKRISIRTSEESDPSEFYIIRRNTMFQTNVLALKKEGLILDLNPGISYTGDKQTGFQESEIRSITFI